MPEAETKRSAPVATTTAGGMALKGAGRLLLVANQLPVQGLVGGGSNPNLNDSLRQDSDADADADADAHHDDRRERAASANAADVGSPPPGPSGFGGGGGGLGGGGRRSADGGSVSFRSTRAEASGVLTVADCFARQQNIKCLSVGCVPDEQRVMDGLSDEDYAEARDVLMAEHGCVPVFLPNHIFEAYYRGFCKSILWPLFHYIHGAVRAGGSMPEMWEGYKAANAAFADVVAAIAKPDDIIWVHDYHLLLLPQMLRARGLKNSIGFFLHTPFPASEVYRHLPARKDLLMGVLAGADLVGFQTYHYARQFINTCSRLMALEGDPSGVRVVLPETNTKRFVSVGVFPTGIDPYAIAKDIQLDVVQEKITEFRQQFEGKHVIVGYDRLDRIKGLDHKFKAFHELLETYPKWRGKVVLVQVAQPHEHESTITTALSDLSGKTNGAFGDINYTPIVYLHKRLSRAEQLAMFHVADVCLVSSVRDGMNLTANEYVACHGDDKPGVVVLSEFAGIAESFSGAVLVNPWDYREVAQSLDMALDMKHDQKLSKHKLLHKYVHTNTMYFWAESYMRELLRACDADDAKKSMRVPALRLTATAIADACRASKKRLLLLDYDGTLTAIRSSPGEAVPPERNLASLQTLGQDPNTIVYIISGRDRDALQTWLGHLPLGFSAEHGCFIREPGATKWEDNVSPSDISVWKREVTKVMQYYTERTPHSLVETKHHTLTWHYRLSDQTFAEKQAMELVHHLQETVLTKHPLDLILGKKNVEVRPQGLNKGTIVRHLLEKHHDADFVFCAGDDVTDEDMFKAMKEKCTPEQAAFTCLVGLRPSYADAHVKDTYAMEDILEAACSAIRSTSPTPRLPSSTHVRNNSGRAENLVL